MRVKKLKMCGARILVMLMLIVAFGIIEGMQQEVRADESVPVYYWVETDNTLNVYTLHLR